MMRYASVCDGIGAVHVGWRPLGWSCAWTSEIEPYPAAVVDHRFPGTVNLGDMLAISEERVSEHGPIDLLVGGTPCQSFSLAGLRGGLADARGNLALRFVQLAAVMRPRWVVWENVPGVLSSHKGRDFAAIVGGLVKCGYGCFWRVLDAQYFGVPQRRRRVFLVGHSGPWQRAAAVLLERHCLRGDSPPSREAGADVAGCVGAGIAGDRGGVDDNDARAGHLVSALNPSEGVAPCLQERDGKGQDSDWTKLLIAHALTGTGYDASEDGTGRGVPIIPFDTTQITSAGNYSNPKPGDPCHPLAEGGHAPAIAYQCHGGSVGPMGTLKDQHTGSGIPFIEAAVAYALGATRRGVGQGHNTTYTPTQHGVRRLLPVECERLQGFPDGYTLIDFKGKPAADAKRYAALGNSMATTVMRWLGERIQAVDAIPSLEANAA